MPDPSQSPEALLAQALALFNAGRVKESAGLVTGVLTTSSGCAPAHHLLGLVSLAEGNLAQAAERVATAISLDPENALFHRNLAEISRRLGRLDDAVSAGRRSCELAPGDPEARNNLGLALFDQGLFEEAVLAYQGALAIRPSHGETWNNLGVALERSGQKTDAELAYARAIRLTPENAMAQLNLGRIYKRQGRLREAQDCFDVAKQVVPGLAEKTGTSIRMAPTHVVPPPICVRDTGTIKGRGVYATRDFEPGERVESCPVVLIQTAHQGLPGELVSFLFDWGTLCGHGRAQALVLGYGSLYNHDNPANMRYEANPENQTLNFIAVRAIQAGEELTINYNARGGGAVWNDNNWFDRMNITPI